MEIELTDARGDIKAHLALHGERLQRDGPVLAADQNVGAETCRDRHFRCRPSISAGEHAGIAAGVGEYGPNDHTAGRDADVEPAGSHGARSSSSPAWPRKTQFTFFCEPTISPMLDDIAQVSVPSWIRRGCAFAGANT